MRRCGYEGRTKHWTFVFHILVPKALVNSVSFYVEFSLYNYKKLGLKVAVPSSKSNNTMYRKYEFNTHKLILKCRTPRSTSYHIAWIGWYNSFSLTITCYGNSIFAILKETREKRGNVKDCEGTEENKLRQRIRRRSNAVVPARQIVAANAFWKYTEIMLKGFLGFLATDFV